MSALIETYFKDLSDTQRQQIEQLGPLYTNWNQRINVISRKDIDQLYEHHILHSLAITKLIKFKPESNVLDLGTGGGFPGIPLAILFPEVEFTLIDGTRKKIQVVQAVADAINLANVSARHIRAEEYKGPRFDFVVSRAVAPLPKLAEWSFRLITDRQQHALPNGLIALKGGDMTDEIKSMPRGSYVETYPITKYIDRPYFETKQLVYAQF